MQEKFLGGLAAIILVEGVEVLDAIIDKLVNLEQEMGLVSKQFPGDIFILIRVQNIVRADRCEYWFDEILESLINKGLHLSFELGGPLLFGEVVLEILVNFALNEFLGLKNSLVHGVEES